MRNLDPCLGVVLQAQLQCRSSLQSSAASLHPHCSSVSLTPGFPHALTSDSALHDISGDYDLRGVLTDTTNTIRVEEGSSNHPRGLSCVGRFIWQDVRSFPPLSPYSNSKSRVDQVKKWSDRKYWYLFTSMIEWRVVCGSHWICNAVNKASCNLCVFSIAARDKSFGQPTKPLDVVISTLEMLSSCYAFWTD